MLLTIAYVDFWKNITETDSVFYNLQHAFAQYGYSLQIENGNINADIVVSTGGNVRNVQFYTGFKILFTGENNTYSRKQYDNDKLVRELYNCYIGFDRDEDDFKIRIPLWIFYYPFYKKEQCEQYKKIKENSPPTDFSNRLFKVCLVARNKRNEFQLRQRLVAQFRKDNVQMDCPSVIGKNMPTIKEQGLNKHKFIKKYMFNFCPENSQRDGYITEKLPQALFANCIPIYWGDPEMECDIFNTNRIIYIQKPHDLTCISSYIKFLLSDTQRLEQIYTQPLFKPDAHLKIDSYIAKFNKIPQLYIKWPFSKRPSQNESFRKRFAQKRCDHFK